MKRIIDLSHTIESGTITYPGLPAPVITDHLTREESRRHYDQGTEFHIGRIEMVANTGTYLDTPFHRYPYGHDLAGLPLEHAADLPGVCIPANGPELSPELLEGHDIGGKAVLFSTGWDANWGTGDYGNPEHPYVGEALAESLVHDGAVLVGIDSVNIDDTRGGSRPAHTRLLAAEIPIVEHLTGLAELAGHSFRFFALPPAIRGMGTFPVRAFAILA